MDATNLERGSLLCPHEERLFQDDPFLLRKRFGVGWLLPLFVLLTSGATNLFTHPTVRSPYLRIAQPFVPHTDGLAGAH